ncbi:hypothetical protein ASD60_23295 [Pseudomonas sp. Root562]|nr:hypothetical protein ASD60_23295 [Pseudomonas sp. Root562]
MPPGIDTVRQQHRSRKAVNGGQVRRCRGCLKAWVALCHQSPGDVMLPSGYPGLGDKFADVPPTIPDLTHRQATTVDDRQLRGMHINT